MGRQAVRIFEEAERLGGLRAKIALAVETRISSTEATGTPDSPELIERLQAGLARVRAMDSKPPSQPPSGRSEESRAREPGPTPATVTGARAEQALRRQQRAILDLMSQRALLLGDVDSTLRRITESAADAMDVERVSVWRVDAGVTKITCADLFERSRLAHAAGDVLVASDHPSYFAAMRLERTIAANDAIRDPRTSDFAESYLAPRGIGAMLDVPLWVTGKMVGVLCHEHVGGPRTWSSDEEAFAYLLASFASLVMELDARR